MEDRQKEIDVTIDNVLIDHMYLDYVSRENREIIMKRLAFNQSVVCGFKDKETQNLLFCVVFDFEPNCLHVREVGGYFGRIYEVLNVFAEGFAKYKNFETISFNTNSRAIEKWAEKSGFQREWHTENEFLKRLH